MERSRTSHAGWRTKKQERFVLLIVQAVCIREACRLVDREGDHHYADPNGIWVDDDYGLKQDVGPLVRETALIRAAGVASA
jgi:hypothetical protein